MGAWVVGRNLAGYLPESDTYAFADWADAYETFKDEARTYADENDELNDELASPDWSEDDYGSMRATVDSILADGDDRKHGLSGQNESAGMVVGDSDDRPISFWLQWSDDREPEEDD